MEPKKNKLDRWLDQALDEYGHAEPRLGLETRILATLVAEKTSITKRTLWPWAFASVAVALTMVVAILVWNTQKSQGSSINLANNDTAIQQKEPAVSMKSEQVQTSTTAKRGVRKQPAKASELAKAPKLDRFPSVRELSAQEQLLVRYAREFPEKALETSHAQALAEQERLSGELAAE